MLFVNVYACFYFEKNQELLEISRSKYISKRLKKIVINFNNSHPHHRRHNNLYNDDNLLAL